MAYFKPNRTAPTKAKTYSLGKVKVKAPKMPKAKSLKVVKPKMPKAVKVKL